MTNLVKFSAADQVELAANYSAPPTPSTKGIVLLHMMPATKESWRDFVPKLVSAGYQVLAIDLRGHGQSGGGDFRSFSDAEHQKSILDVGAAVAFLQGKGVTSIAVVGASFGANLALQYLTENSATKAVVLLSPGLDYRGLAVAPLLAKFSDKRKVFLVGADDDTANMGETCEQMSRGFGLSEKICYPDGGHGTNLFQSHPDLMAAIVKYLGGQF